MKSLSLSGSSTATNIVADTVYNIKTEWLQPREIHADWTETTVSATVSLQISFDDTIWTDIETPTAMSGDTIKTWTVDRHTPYMRVYVDWTSGAVTTLKVLVSSLPY